MSEPSAETVDEQRTRLQTLFAKGWISLDEYTELGRRHGFISPEPALPSSPAAKALTVASWSGFALLALGAITEIASIRYPELKGPLETLSQLASLIAKGL